MASELSQTRTLGEATQGPSSLSLEDIDRKAAEVVQYFLIMEQSKIPVKRPDLVKNFGLPSKQYKTVFEKAKTTLEEVFGCTIYEMKSKSNTYFLKNILTDSSPNMIKPTDLKHQHGILFITLSAIYLNRGHINEDDLLLILDTLGYSEEDKKLITTDFEKQQYIIANLIPQTEPPKRAFRWGERAEVEVSKLDVIDFASQLYNTEKSSFGKLYSDLIQPQEPTDD